MSTKQRKIPAPAVSSENEPFWNATAQGKLLVKRCTACGEAHHYPRTICPFCFSDKTEWTDASGRGTIYSYSVMRRAAVPYAIAFVTLAEGATIMANIVDCDLDAVSIGMEVRLIFRDSAEGEPYPVFRPAARPGA